MISQSITLRSNAIFNPVDNNAKEKLNPFKNNYDFGGLKDFRLKGETALYRIVKYFTI